MEVVVDRPSVASLSTQQFLFRYVGVDSLFQIEGVILFIILSLWVKLEYWMFLSLIICFNLHSL